MKEYLIISQIIVSILLIISILLQQRGTALGSAFGGGGEFYASRRGFQKFLFYFTVILAISFVVLALFNLFFE